MGTVLVTGAAGFIGSHLVERLLSDGREVVGLDDFNDYYNPAIKRRNIEPLLEKRTFALVEGDIRDTEALDRLFRDFRPKHVMHLAARAGVRLSVEDPQIYIDVNVTGTLGLLRRSIKAGVEKFLNASSSSVYGLSKDAPFREDSPLGLPASPYAASKIAGEAYCHTYHHLSGMPITCLRFFTVYGPRQRPDMAIHRFARRILNGDEISLFGDGSSRRDYTFIDDIINGVVAALDHCSSYEVYNLGNSNTVDLKRLVAVLEDACGKKANTTWRPNQPGDVPLTHADVSKAARDLGYSPQVDLEEGIPRFIDWLRDQG
ncbi:MAG: SDR family NAD(P)-dependent oxidoreductase [Proteobacteria bacterium]|nr:SDR family NAD(P)-dependent oxidoreductase [Pseudomonadota bacterium]